MTTIRRMLRNKLPKSTRRSRTRARLYETYVPHAQFIPRTGQINAWDNPPFVEAIEKTRRKTVAIAGTWNRAEGSRFAEIIAEHIVPNYRCLMESFTKAQAVVNDGPETQMDKIQ